MPSNQKAKFSDGEKLLCYHGPLLYEAKCVRSKKDGNQCYYYIHYQGWNQKWDEWVAETRIVKITQENLEKKEKLLNSHMNAVKDSKKKSSTRPAGPETPTSKTPAIVHSSGTASKRQGMSGVSSKSNSGVTGNSSFGTPVEGAGGTDSANTSRASTPASDRSFKVGPSREKGSATKRVQADDERSTSSREDEVQVQTTSSSKRRHSSKKARLSTSSLTQMVDRSDNTVPEVESDQEEKSEVGENLGKNSVNKYKIPIPEELKYVLVSDWDLVIHKKKLFTLPAKVTVASILSDWVKYAESSTMAAKLARVNTVIEVAAGIRDFFDAFVKKHLLYQIEQRQHEKIMKGETKAPSEIYGSAHLLRLMVKIGGFLDQFNVNGDESDVKLIESTAGDLLNYLEGNRVKLFTSKNYLEVSDEYLNAK